MSIQIIQSKLNQYNAKNVIEEINAIKEISQEIALSGLSRAGFFKEAAFQGGTCLRIFYGLNRFSEDLDFALKEPNSSFHWQVYLKSLQAEFAAYGYQLEIQDRSASPDAVKVGFLKDSSIGKLLFLQNKQAGQSQTIKIKLEIDTNPPSGASDEQKYLDFPVTVPVITHDLPSLFAGKSHALLCRKWEKGRDWYDFIWYVAQKVPVNFVLLANALEQAGPWVGQKIPVNKAWYLNELRKKIESTDWNAHKKDVARFLKRSDLDLLELWSTEFFLNRLSALEKNL